MNYYLFTAAWFLLFGVLLVTLPSLGIAPLPIRNMTDTVLHSLKAAAEHTADIPATMRYTTAKHAVAAPSYEAAAPSIAGIRPERIVIESIGVSTLISYPETTDTNVLDAALQNGVVQYPGSGYLNEDSNIFLFGHSTGLPNVRNQAYRAFNKLDTLHAGDTVKLYAGDEVHVYAVTGVLRAKADEALVTFSTGKKMLTLSTCNTFGKKEDRFIVTAEFIQRMSLTESM